MLDGCPPCFADGKLRHGIGGKVYRCLDPNVLWVQCNTDVYLVSKSCLFSHWVFVFCPEPSPWGAPGWGPELDRHPYLTVSQLDLEGGRDEDVQPYWGQKSTGLLLHPHTNGQKCGVVGGQAGQGQRVRSHDCKAPHHVRNKASGTTCLGRNDEV